MLYRLFAGLLGLFGLQTAGAALPTGAPAPDFQATASLAGKAFNFSLKEQLKKGPVVVYFYPAAYTSGCNVQAHTFSTLADKFAAAGASIIGVSLDNIDRLNDFSADPDYCAGKFPVAADPDGKITKSFELSIRKLPFSLNDSRGKAIDHGFAERTTFVITSDGKIAANIGGVSPKENVEQALSVVQKLANSRSPVR